MNDNDELKARSIELAERAFRLRDRAPDTKTEQKLHATGNELININNRQRFYDAQRSLEIAENWTEDQRALAHEISVADRNLRGIGSVDIKETLETLQQWVIAANTKKVTDNPTTLLNQHLEKLLTTGNESGERDSVTYVLSYIEDALQFAHNDENPQDEITYPIILNLRNFRDSLIVHRELLYDEDELITKYQNESEKIQRLGLARQQLDELYKAARK
jgi:hypothetical protein